MAVYKTVDNPAPSLGSMVDKAHNALMLASESTKRKPGTKGRGRVAAKPSLSPEQILQLADFTRFAAGDGHLTWWEEGFLNSIKNKLYNRPVWLSEKEQYKVRQIKEKLHFDRPAAPLPPIDPDGITENDDPDGWPVIHEMEPANDDDLPDFLADV
jgi:hypothetical protein